MIAGRIAGWLLVAAALVAAGAEAVHSLEAGVWRPLGLGVPFFGPDAPGLAAARAALGARLPASLAGPAALFLTAVPAWLLLALVGGALAALCRPRPRRHFF